MLQIYRDHQFNLRVQHGVADVIQRLTPEPEIVPSGNAALPRNLRQTRNTLGQNGRVYNLEIAVFACFPTGLAVR